MNESDSYMTIAEVAAELRVTRATVRKLMEYGGLPTVKIGSIYRVARADLENWIAENKKRANNLEAWYADVKKEAQV